MTPVTVYFSNNHILRKGDHSKITYDFDRINNLKNMAEKFFFANNITKFQEAILSALYWYGRVDITYDDAVDQYISYINGLERLVLFDESRNKAEVFSQRISCRFPTTDKDEIASLYEKRNRLLHENEPDIYEDELDRLRGLLRGLILNMINESENHSILYSYFKKYDKN